MTGISFGVAEEEQAEVIDGERHPRDFLTRQTFANELVVLVAGLLRTVRPEVLIRAVDAKIKAVRKVVVVPLSRRTAEKQVVASRDSAKGCRNRDDRI